LIFDDFEEIFDLGKIKTKHSFAKQIWISFLEQIFDFWIV
jgi:hypothetical protein